MIEREIRKIERKRKTLIKRENLTHTERLRERERVEIFINFNSPIVHNQPYIESLYSVRLKREKERERSRENVKRSSR